MTARTPGIAAQPGTLGRLRTTLARISHPQVERAILDFVALAFLPALFVYTADPQQLAALGDDAADFVGVVQHLLHAPGFDPFAAPGGGGYGWPYFTLVTLLCAPLTALGVPDLPTIAWVLALVAAWMWQRRWQRAAAWGVVAALVDVLAALVPVPPFA